MAVYRAPLQDMRFLFDAVFKMPEHYAQLSGCQPPDADTLGMMLDSAASFCEEVLHPLYRRGDEAGCRFEQGQVTMPPGYREAREIFVKNGWTALAAPEDFGGQKLPGSVGIILNEMMCATNPPWVMLVGLPQAVMLTMDAHGADWQREKFFPGLVDGRYGATMCLTEAHAGTDLGMLRTRAVPQQDGSYEITGTKIFISFGEHDLVENIIHLVLAKLPDAPEGTAGISMFVVPKRLIDEDGKDGPLNGVSCGAIEHKMGYMASPTCVMNFDGARGWLVGNPNEGLKNMFTLMNNARIGSGMQALGLADASYQGALAYARERLQMRSLSGAKNPQGPADPIIVHPGVRQLLLTQKAFTEGCRALLHDAARLADVVAFGRDEETRKTAYRRLGFLTPIVKGFVTEVGYESVNHGVQVMGGHGYMREHGMEQLVRDCRISTIYEGTTQVQALDLVGRKIMMTQARDLQVQVDEILACCEHCWDCEPVASLVPVLREHADEWLALGREIMLKAMGNLDEAGAASVDYLMYSGYVMLAWYWLRMAVAAQDQSDAGLRDAKLSTARFYFDRILPRTRGLAASIRSGGASLMVLSEEAF